MPSCSGLSGVSDVDLRSLAGSGRNDAGGTKPQGDQTMLTPPEGGT